MKEGFEQPTDAAFGNFVLTAKGSLEEVITRVRQAQRKGLVSDTDLARVEELGAPPGKMMGGFIKYLNASRLHQSRPPRCRPKTTTGALMG